MPWCTTCDRYLAAPTVRPDGTCPTCGRPVDAGRVLAPPTEQLPPLPWHFKLLLGALALYLGWRAVEIVTWLL